MKDISDNAQEILESLWIHREEKKRSVSAEGLRDSEALKELLEAGLAKSSGETITLTDKGLKEAEACVRRHRLSERLMADVFNLKKQEIHKIGCKFEHIIHKELEENICTLLGHPSECPHGTSIPPGECCKKFKKHPQPVIKSVADMKKGETGMIAYIHTQDKSGLQKIMALGALPGNAIQLIQRFPSYVFRIGHSQFAVDANIAGKIFVRVK